MRIGAPIHASEATVAEKTANRTAGPANTQLVRTTSALASDQVTHEHVIRGGADDHNNQFHPPHLVADTVQAIIQHHDDPYTAGRLTTEAIQRRVPVAAAGAVGVGAQAGVAAAAGGAHAAAAVVAGAKAAVVAKLLLCRIM